MAQLPTALEYVKSLDAEVSDKWIKFLDNFKGKRSNNNTAKINTFITVKYRDYLIGLERKAIAREDFESVLANKHKFNVIYTDNDTYLSKDKDFKPIEFGMNLFEGL